jgi:hypothetical protein
MPRNSLTKPSQMGRAMPRGKKLARCGAQYGMLVARTLYKRNLGTQKVPGGQCPVDVPFSFQPPHPQGSSEGLLQV